ncbi:MAG: hydantoinase B/oxoprolinase family protein [Planctomycetes bacterium]|nr:hydantoinase B/oxoprolinase family protein [Planctomycetota bacterium]
MAKASIDPVRLEVFHHLLSAFCEEAGVRLQRSAISPNIRERADFSIAVFDRRGQLVAQAAHIPVHLGSAGDAVAAVRRELELAPGDVIVLNDPYAGGTHLPDVTLVRPVFVPGGRQPEWFLVNRAHHADIGGGTPGSMGIAADLFAEGLVIPPLHLRRRGVLQQDFWRLFQRNVRGAAERAIDLQAQEASLAQLDARLVAFAAAHGLAAVRSMQQQLLDYTERAARTMLRGLPEGHHHRRDRLEDDGFGNGELWIDLRLWLRPDRVVFDWRATCDQAKGGVNANRSIALAACVYALRCLCPDRLPTNEGLFRLIELRTRPGSLVDPRSPAPVAGGNVETSQRLVDIVFAALAAAAPARLPAASAGTMSNLSFGGVRADGSEFTSYETLPGGAGATAQRAGQSALQTHMTNTRNTPIEETEHRFPVLVRSLSVRRGSGGRGARDGGCGIEKVVEARAPLRVSFLGERHRSGPPGAAGGGAGRPGSLSVRRGGRLQRLPAKASFELSVGEQVVVATPGGGAHGRKR